MRDTRVSRRKGVAKAVLVFASISVPALSSVLTAKPVDRPAPVASVNVGTKLAWHATRAPHLLWTGFRAQHDGGEVLIQTSAEVEIETRTDKDGPIFVLKGCKVLRRTDQLPLETRYFDSPVTRVSMKRHAGDLEIAVSLRQPVTAVPPRKEAGPGGSWFWVLAFPTPDKPTTDKAAATTTAAATP